MVQNLTELRCKCSLLFQIRGILLNAGHNGVKFLGVSTECRLEMSNYTN